MDLPRCFGRLVCVGPACWRLPRRRRWVLDFGLAPSTDSSYRGARKFMLTEIDVQDVILFANTTCMFPKNEGECSMYFYLDAFCYSVIILIISFCF